MGLPFLKGNYAMNKKIKDFYVKKMQKIIIVSVVIVFISMSVCGCTRKEDVELLKLSMEETPLEYGADVIQTATDGKSEYSDEEYTATDDEPVMIQVHICGAVNNPGVYGLPKGSRIYEAVKPALPSYILLPQSKVCTERSVFFFRDRYSRQRKE